ncbi:MAG: HAD family phosphatase [Deltaproteobacteria bacterium]|nr:HAD family phosphatase [Deltaproteobacteria bacterium]
MIRVVVFDLGNVITPFDHTTIAPALHARSRIGDRVTPREIHEHIFDWGAGCYIPYEEGAITTGEFVRALCRRFEIDVDIEGFKAIWNPIFSQDYEVAAIVRDLKAKGVPLVLLSNTNEMHFDYIWERYTVIHSFDEVIVSHRVRCRKPHRAIYEELLRRVQGVPPGDVLFIDDWEKNTAGAEALGIRTHLFRGADGLRDALRGIG